MTKPYSKSFPIIDFWAETWIGSVVQILLSCSFFSIFSLLRLGAWLGAATALAWAGFRIRHTGRSVFTVPRFHGIGWGIPVLLALCLVSLLAGPHCFLDSYSYRIPQMLFWLQEGHPWSIPNVDMRINQMPHVWPMVSASFFLPLGERALALPNFLSLLLLTALFRFWAHRVMDGGKADAVALIFLSAPVFLMGGATNDNVVTCVTFLALSFHFAEQFRSLGDNPRLRRRALALSAVSFSLCCGIKPQYLVLAPLWGAWFLFAPSRPWRSLSPRFIAVLVPILLLCSPLPTFAVNQLRWGSYSSPWVVDTADPQPRCNLNKKPRPVSVSYGMLANDLLSPAINPAFSIINGVVQRESNFFTRHLNQREWKSAPMAIAEGASLGLWSFSAFLVGLIVAVLSRECRKTLHRSRAWIVCFPISVMALFCIAVWITRAGSVGRSFIGFFILLFPIAMSGFGKVPRSTVNGWTALCIANALFLVMLNPARPLWPVEHVRNRISNHSQGLARTLSDYAHFSHRHESPDRLLEVIPASETRLGVLVQAGEPIADCWLHRKGPTQVYPYPRTLTAARLRVDGVRFLVVKDNGLPAVLGDEWLQLFSERIGAEQVAVCDNVTYMKKGPETWRLFLVGPLGSKP